MYSLFRNLSYKKIVALYLAAFLVVLSGTMGVYYRMTSDILSSQVNKSDTALLNQSEKDVDKMLDEINREIMNFEQQPELAAFITGEYSEDFDRHMNTLTLMNQMRSLINSNDSIHSIYVYSSLTGNVLTNTSYGKEDEFSDAAWLKPYQAMKDESQWLPRRKIASDKGSSNVVTFITSYPAYIAAPSSEGAVVVNINEDAVKGIIENTGKGTQGDILIIDKDGAPVSNWNTAPVLLKAINRDFIRSIVRNGESDGLSGNIQNNTGRINYLTSPMTQWKYISVMPMAQSSGQLIAFRKVVLFVYTLILAVGAFLVIFLSKFTFEPYDRFAHSIVRRIGNSDPVNCKIDLAALDKSIDQMIGDRERIKKQISENIPAIRWKLANDLLLGNVKSLEEIGPKLELAGMRLLAGSFIVLIVEYDDEHVQPDEQFSISAREIADKAIGEENPGISVEIGNSKIAVILSFENFDVNGNGVRVLSAASRMRSAFVQNFDIAVTIGIGRFYKDISEIKNSYLDAAKALSYKIIMGNHALICAKDIKVNEEPGYSHVLLTMADSVSNSLNSANFDQISRKIDGLMAEAIREHMPPDVVRELGLNVIIESVKKAREIGVDVERIMEEKHYRAYLVLEHLETIDEIKNYIQNILKQFVQEITAKRNNHSSGLINSVKTYIDENYMKYDLTLSRLADTFHFSVPYMSKIFKENMETNFTDYLACVRMEKAKALLAQSDQKVNEIALKVGYCNTHSFIRIFKGHTGMTPREYKNTCILKKVSI